MAIFNDKIKIWCHIFVDFFGTFIYQKTKSAWKKEMKKKSYAHPNCIFGLFRNFFFDGFDRQIENFLDDIFWHFLRFFLHFFLFRIYFLTVLIVKLGNFLTIFSIFLALLALFEKNVFFLPHKKTTKFQKKRKNSLPNHL